MSILKIYNAKAVLENSILENASIIIEDGKIIGVEQGNPDIADCEKIDANGNFVSAGFIDIHTHGAGGSDFMDCTIDACKAISKAHAEHGTTLLYPTTLASDNAELMTFLEVYNTAKPIVEGARFGGIHLEGPYFSYKFRGAQDPKHLRNPSPEEYMEILDGGFDIKRWSIAPELEGASELAKKCVERGILPSIAHTDSIYEEVVDAHKNGYTLITHFYSCMNTMTRRNAFKYAGCIEAGLLIEDMDIEIIADGLHVPEPFLKLVLKNKSPDHIALITDSMRAAGTSDKKSILGSLKKGQEVIIEDNVAKLCDRTAFAGSIATGDRLIRTMINIAGCPLPDAIKMATQTPARIMGASTKGKLAKGFDADIIIFDKDINIQKTIIDGKTVYAK